MTRKTRAGPANPVSLVISTDVDGTLLDHHTYGWQAAATALDRLREHKIPLILNTSKTAEEVRALLRELNITDPFIVENGSAVYLRGNETRFAIDETQSHGGYQVRKLGAERQDIVATLQAVRREFQWRFEGFSDFNLERIAALTGLTTDAARLAQSRQYSEPLLWEDTEANFTLFTRHISSRGYRILRGGRFIHVLGDTDKGQALLWLAKRYHCQTAEKNSQVKIIALGDSGNDIEMLAVADHPVLVKSPAHDFPAMDSSDTMRTSEFGPKGWNLAVHALLDRYLSETHDGK